MCSTTESPKEHFYQHHKSQSFNFHTKKSSASLQKSLDEHKGCTTTAYTIFMATPVASSNPATKSNQHQDYSVSPISIQESMGVAEVVHKKRACYVPMQVTIPTCCLRSQLNELQRRNQLIANSMSQPPIAEPSPLLSNETNNTAPKLLPTAIEVIATIRPSPLPAGLLFILVHFPLSFISCVYD